MIRLLRNTSSRLPFLLLALVAACGAPSGEESGPGPVDGDDQFVQMHGIDGEPLLMAVMSDASWGPDAAGEVELEAVGRHLTLSRSYRDDLIVLTVEENDRLLASAEFGPDYLGEDDSQRRLLASDGAMVNDDPLAHVDALALVVLLPANWAQLDLLFGDGSGSASEALRVSQVPRYSPRGLIDGNTACIGACSGACAGACIGQCVWNPYGSSCNQCVTLCMDHCTSEC